MSRIFIMASALRVALIYVDLFCGAGGTSTGVELSSVNGEKCAKVIACVNHDKNAIISHARNHPETLHFTEDIRTLDLTELIRHVKLMRLKFPFAKLVLWASLECTNHSNAKGGLSRDADSRTLAEHLGRYIIELDPDCIQIENVKEFLQWGPLMHKHKNGEPLFDKLGKPVMVPVPEKKGIDYLAWINRVQALGYAYEHKILNSADFSARTKRKRLFIQFAKAGFPIVWAEPTHSETGDNLPKYKPVRECLDFSQKGKSIFEGKPRSEKTLTRLMAGLVKFVANGDKEWIVKYNSMNASGHHRPPSVDEPCPTIPAQTRLGLAQVEFLSKYYSGGGDSNNQSVENPAGTVMPKDKHALVTPEFISKYYSGHPDSKNISLDNPAGAVTCVDHHALVQPEFLSAYYGTGDNVSSINSPAPTVTCVDRLAKVECEFLDQQYGNSKPASIDNPINTLTVNPKFAMVNTEFLYNPQYSNKGGSVDAPCFTLIARMDKMPPYIVQMETGELAIEVYTTDSPMTVQIKKFMATYGISDIKMRMLYVKELLQIQGFPVNYILVGNQAEQKKFIGNSVEVNTAKAMCEATAKELLKRNKRNTLTIKKFLPVT